MKKGLKTCGIVVGIAVAIAIVMHLLNPFWFRFPRKIETKEEMISFLENNQEELEKIVEKLIVLYKESDEYIVGIYDSSYMEYNFHEADDIIRNYPISHIWIDEDEDQGIVVTIYFKGAPALHDFWGSRYWGITYAEDGEPVPSMSDVEMEKQGNEYVESVQGMYEHRTERIVGNWYYFQQQWCSSTPF